MQKKFTILIDSELYDGSIGWLAVLTSASLSRTWSALMSGIMTCKPLIKACLRIKTGRLRPWTGFKPRAEMPSMNNDARFGGSTLNRLWEERQEKPYARLLSGRRHRKKHGTGSRLYRSPRGLRRLISQGSPGVGPRAARNSHQGRSDRQRPVKFALVSGCRDDPTRHTHDLERAVRPQPRLL